MQPLQVILEMSNGDKRIIQEYFLFKSKHGNSSVPKPCLTRQALQVLRGLFGGKFKEQIAPSAAMCVIYCLQEFTLNEEDNQAWLEFSTDVVRLFQKCVEFLLFTREELRKKFLGKFLPTLKAIIERGHPVSTKVFCHLGKTLISVALQESMPKDEQAAILETVEMALLKADISLTREALSKMTSHLNALSSLIFKVSFETQLSILDILLRSTVNKAEAEHQSGMWFQQYPKIQKAFVQLHCKPYPEASGEFLSRVYEVTTKSVSRICGDTLKCGPHSDTESNRQPQQPSQHTNTESKEIANVKQRSSCDVYPKPEQCKVSVPGHKAIIGKPSAVTEGRLLIGASEVQTNKISGSSFVKGGSCESQKNAGYKLQEPWRPGIQQDASSDVGSYQLSSRQSRLPRPVQDLYKKNTLAAPSHPNRWKSLSLRKALESECSGIKLSAVDDKANHELQIKCQQGILNQNTKPENHFNEVLTVMDEDENELNRGERIENKNLKRKNTLMQEYQSEHLNQHGRIEQSEQSVVCKRQEQTPRKKEVLHSKSTLLEKEKSPLLSRECSSICDRRGLKKSMTDLRSDDQMGKIQSWLETNVPQSPTHDDEVEVIVMNEQESAISRSKKRMTLGRENTRVKKVCLNNSPAKLVQKEREDEDSEVVLVTSHTETPSNIHSAVEKVQESEVICLSDYSRASEQGKKDTTVFRKPEGFFRLNNLRDTFKQESLKKCTETRNSASDKNFVPKHVRGPELKCMKTEVKGDKQNKNCKVQVFQKEASPELKKKKCMNFQGNEAKRGDVPYDHVKVTAECSKIQPFKQSSGLAELEDCSSVTTKRERGKQLSLFTIKEPRREQTKYKPVVCRNKNYWQLKLKDLEQRSSAKTERNVSDVYDFPASPKIIKRRRYTQSKETEKHGKNSKSRYASVLSSSTNTDCVKKNVENHKITSSATKLHAKEIAANNSRGKEVIKHLVSGPFVNEGKFIINSNEENYKKSARTKHETVKTERKKVVAPVSSCDDKVTVTLTTSNRSTNITCRSNANRNSLQEVPSVIMPSKQDKHQQSVPRPNSKDMRKGSSDKKLPVLSSHCKSNEVFHPNTREDIFSCTEAKENVQGKTTDRKMIPSGKDLDSGVDLTSNFSDDLPREQNTLFAADEDHRISNLSNQLLKAKLANEKLCASRETQPPRLKHMEYVNLIRKAVVKSANVDRTAMGITRKQKGYLDECFGVLHPQEDKTFKVLIPPDPEPDAKEGARRLRAEALQNLPRFLKRMKFSRPL